MTQPDAVATVIGELRLAITQLEQEQRMRAEATDGAELSEDELRHLGAHIVGATWGGVDRATQGIVEIGEFWLKCDTRKQALGAWNWCAARLRPPAEPQAVTVPARIQPTAPAIPAALIERAREIAPQLPSPEFLSSDSHNFHATFRDAAALVRDIAALRPAEAK
jgi:hypothetical protein